MKKSFSKKSARHPAGKGASPSRKKGGKSSGKSRTIRSRTGQDRWKDSAPPSKKGIFKRSGGEETRPRRVKLPPPDAPVIPPPRNVEKFSASDSLDLLEKSMHGERSLDFLQDGSEYRINRFLAAAGFGSRREVERLVQDRRVKVNGEIITSLDVRVKRDDLVFLDDRPVHLPGESSYVILNKPEGYVVSRRSFAGQKTIYALLPTHMQNLKYAGRLDRESRGVVILSDDGNFINAVTHPARRLTKRYIVKVDHLVSEQEMQRAFYHGVEDAGELLRALRVTVLDRNENLVEVVLGEGKNRQIRRMFKKLRMRVLDLYRVSVGFFDLTKTPVDEGKFISVNPAHILYGEKKESDEGAGILKDFRPWKS